MAALVEGTYAIISVRSSKAVDVSGASDKSGANVIQWNHTNGDAQIWNCIIPDKSETVEIDGQTEYLWQMMCSLSGKVLAASDAAPKQNTNVCQKDDTDAINSQRWILEDLNKTHTYKGTAYEVYAMHPAGNTSLAMDVAGASTDPGTNILLWGYNASSTNQQWIFVPVPAFTETLQDETHNVLGTYKIGLVADTSKRVDIEAAAQKNGAQALVWTANDVDNQIFAIERDDQSGCVRFVAAHSGRALDIAAQAASDSAPVVQWTRKEMSASDIAKQFWYPFSLNKTVNYNGQDYPIYVLRSQSAQNYVMDCLGGKVQNMTKIGVWPYNGAKNQQFFFMKTERNLNDIDMPGPIDQTTFERTGNGDVLVTGLTFQSSRRHFQARYRVDKFRKNRTDKTQVRGWTSVKLWKGVITPEEEPDEEQRAKKTELLRYSTSREGWGDAWSATFDFDGLNNGGIVQMPFEESYYLDNDWQTMEITFEIRAYEPAYPDTRQGNVNQIYYKAHGPIRSTVVKVIQRPTVSVTSMKLFIDNSKNALGVTTTVADSLGNGCERLRARIVDADGEPITEWVSDSSLTINHVANETLRRLPRAGETVYYEYSMLTPDGAAVTGSKAVEFNIGDPQEVPTIDTDITYLEDDSCTAKVFATSCTAEYCLMAIPDSDGTMLVHCSEIATDEEHPGKRAWKVVPPINTDVSIIIMGSNDLANWGVGTANCRIDSHLFIWNWTEGVSSDPYDSFASIIINTDAPPQQTRKYTTSINFNSPSGRVNPVAFSDINMTTDLSIEGVALDEGVDYVGPSSLPNHTSIRYIKQLIRLSGKGIHPIYRTPYGDWHYVGIESVDITKKEMLLCSAAITQRAVED